MLRSMRAYCNSIGSELNGDEANGAVAEELDSIAVKGVAWTADVVIAFRIAEMGYIRVPCSCKRVGDVWKSLVVGLIFKMWNCGVSSGERDRE
jgi:hypothetical protein